MEPGDKYTLYFTNRHRLTCPLAVAAYRLSFEFMWNDVVGHMTTICLQTTLYSTTDITNTIIYAKFDTKSIRKKFKNAKQEID